MSIEWNRVTWYSKLLAIVVFVGTFWLAFCLGSKFERVKNTTTSVSISFPLDLTLKVGESKNVGDFNLVLNKILEDSRCPVDVVCIQAGRVRAQVNFSAGKTSEAKEISSDSKPIVFGIYKISMTDVKPVNTSKKQIETRDYKLSFHITK